MNYNLNADLTNKINEGFTLTEGSLPFPAPVLFVINGDVKAIKDPAPAMFYGGWATDKGSMDTIVENEKRELLKNLVPTGLVNQQGELIDIYATRSVIVAPVVKRVIWITKDGDRTNDFIKGARQHVQVLAILADSAFNIWGPVILSAKGFQAKNLLESFTTWQRHTAVIRAKEAQGIPAWLFFSAIGTFGKDRKQEMVGGGDKKSAITPIDTYLPEMTADMLGKLYGGETLANMIVDLNEKADEWRKAWSGAIQTKSIGSRYGAGPKDRDQPDAEIPDGGEDIPF